MPSTPFDHKLLPLLQARVLANYLGTLPAERPRIASSSDRGGQNLVVILFDCAFQAGLNYRTVVLPRVVELANRFPSAVTIDEVALIIRTKKFRNAIRWAHPEKPRRMKDLVQFFSSHGLVGVSDIRNWLSTSENREKLLLLRGIGPKTVDYLSKLLGDQTIPVDRHMIRWIEKAGMTIIDYFHARKVLEFTADLMEISRRRFDTWLWEMSSSLDEGVAR